MSDFHRVRRLPPYVFEQVNSSRPRPAPAALTSSISAWAIPSLPAPKHVIDKLVETVGKPRTDRYSASKGIAGLRRARPAITRAGSGSSSIPRRRSSPRSARRKASPTWPRRSPRRASGVGPEPLLSDPRFRLPDGGRRHPLGAGRAGARVLRRARARDHAFDPEADRGRRLLSVQPDGDGRLARLLSGPGAVREEARDFRALRPRLCRSLFRR